MHSLPYILITALILSLFPIIYSNPMVNGAENFDRYWSVLTGDQKIPPVTTDARGLVGLKFLDNFSRLVYVVNTENIVIEGFSVPSSLIFPPNTTLNGFISENNYLAKHVFFGFKL